MYPFICCIVVDFIHSCTPLLTMSRKHYFRSLDLTAQGVLPEKLGGGVRPAFQNP